MNIPLPALDPLLRTVHSVTDGRVLNHVARTEEEELVVLRFPVRLLLPGDAKDTALRQFISDWLRRNVEDDFRLGVKHRFEPIEPGNVFWYEDGDGKRHEVPVVGALTFHLWEKAKDEDYEAYRKEKRRQKLEASGI